MDQKISLHFHHSSSVRSSHRHWRDIPLLSVDFGPRCSRKEKRQFPSVVHLVIAVIVMHKIISCSVIYALSESLLNVTLQIFDLMMVKAVYLNYKLGTNEPGNSQRLLQLLEATFESGPQLFISMMFIIKTHETDPLILISAISSLYGMKASKVNIFADLEL
eukprot:482308_1